MSNFAKRMLACTLAGLLLLSAMPLGLAEYYPFSAFASDNVRLRKSAVADGAVVLTVPGGDSVYVIGEKNGYYIVQYEGKQGYILKSYLSENAPEGTESPTQKPASLDAMSNYQSLYINSSGDKVRVLQEALTELQFYTGKIDADYGNGTAKAVRAFQKANGLAQTGAADAATQEALYENTVKNASGKKTTVSFLPPVENFPIRLGKKGEAVTRLKERLEALDYYQATSGSIYDSKTRQAVIAFQKKNGLTADGVAGADTQKLLYQDTALGKNQTATPVPAVTKTPAPGATAAAYPYETTVISSVILRKSASVNSDRITTVAKGAAVTVLAESGDFLKISYKNRTGYVVAAYVNIPKEYLPAELSKYDTLKSGDAGDHVLALQNALLELGFYSGALNGSYSSAVTSAVKSFQTKNKYSVTGVATPAQQRLIYEGKPKNSKGRSQSVNTLPSIEGVSMMQGDKGAQVGALQVALQVLGYYNGTINNTFDKATATAVKAFQKDKGLKQDGVAGDKTQLLLFRLTATPTPVPDGVITPKPTEETLTADNVIVMQNGTRGVAVKKLQNRLTELGYYNVAADGIYDSNDISAVRAFQKKNGLKADGIAGLETQILLYSASALPYATATPAPDQTLPGATPTAPPAATVKPDMNTTLKIGSKGETVKSLQTKLKELKYYTGLVDGRYGVGTANAVRAFQKANKLLADGLAGKQTLSLLFSGTAGSKPGATTAPAEDKTLRLTDSGAAVKAMQQRLVTLGYLKKADGSFGPATYAAVLNFQQRNGLTVDGEVTSAVLKKMNSSSAKRADSSAPPTATPRPSGDDSFTPPKASEVRYANWYTEIRTRARAMPNVVIYDPDTGLHYNLHMFSFGKHVDSEPPTAADTAIMNQVCGVNSWTPHAVWVIFSDGRVYMASTHSHGHTVDHTSGNDLTGHICLHFPRLMEEAEATGPYAVSHQKAILLGWELTQTMIQ